MKTKDFFYYLPEELIAQRPIEPRDKSRMMFVRRDTGEIKHRTFNNIIDLLNENDCLILNDTRVLPARLFAVKEKTNARVEFLLLRRIEEDLWECATGPGK